MSEPEPASPSDPTGDSAYRSISILAIAALALAAMYAALVLLSVVISAMRGDPMFLPGWLFLLPGASIVLAIVALQRIKEAGGILTGGRLARWALVVSVVAGLGYGTFSFFTGLAVQDQANRFLTESTSDAGFFPLLLKGKVTEAFLLTQSWTIRRGANPLQLGILRDKFDGGSDKNPRGPITMFQENSLVQTLANYQDKATIEPLGVRRWDYEEKGYVVERNYRIKTPEGTYEVLVKVHSQDTGDPQTGRKWTVVFGPWMRLPEPKEATPHGEALRAARDLSALFANAWLEHLRGGDRLAAFLATQLPARRADLKATHKKSGKLVALPGYSDFAAFSFLRSDGLDVPAGFPEDRIRGLLPAALVVPESGLAPPPQIKREDTLVSLAKLQGGQFRFAHPLEIPLVVNDSEGIPRRLLVLAKVIVEVDPAAIEGRVPAEWRIAEVNCERVLAFPK